MTQSYLAASGAGDPVSLTCPGAPDTLAYEHPQGVPVVITLNGERFEIERPLTVVELLATLDIDPRRVAIEHNLTILRRQTFPEITVREGDTVEIVNFVGGG